MWDFVLEKVALDMLFSEHFRFSLSISCHQGSRLFIYALLLPEVKSVEAKEPYKSHEFSFGNQIENYFRLVEQLLFRC